MYSGATPDVDTMTDAELVSAVRGGAVDPQEAVASLLTRISNGTQATAPKLSALVSTISNLQKLGATSTTVGPTAQ